MACKVTIPREETYIKKLLILTHENLPLNQLNYYVSMLIPLWQQQGIEVKELRGIDRYEPADAILLHIDLTQIPAEYLAFADRYPLVLNRRVIDIGKRVTSEHLVRPGDCYTGAVIVKTHCNAGAGSEACLQHHTATNWLSRAHQWWKWRRPARRVYRDTTRISPYDYPVYDRVEDVPANVFENPNLVVEKFLPEVKDGYYWTWTTVCCGNRLTHGRYGAKSKIVKTRTIKVLQDLEDSPAPIDVWRSQFGLDYGKLDYAMHDGQPVLYDVNRTPTGGKRRPSPRSLKRAKYLASGIAARMERAA